MYWTSSVVATLHAIIMASGAIARATTSGFQIWSGFDTPEPSWERYVEFSCGYFVYDLWMVADLLR